MENTISNFELRYDGMYHITWSEKEKVHKWYLYLNISTLLKMIEIEGITSKDINNMEYEGEPLRFKKVVLSYAKEDGYYKAWYFFEELYGNTLSRNFIVELFVGDSLKNHKNQTLLGYVKIAD